MKPISIFETGLFMIFYPPSFMKFFGTISRLFSLFFCLACYRLTILSAQNSEIKPETTIIANIKAIKNDERFSLSEMPSCIIAKAANTITLINKMSDQIQDFFFMTSPPSIFKVLPF